MPAVDDLHSQITRTRILGTIIPTTLQNLRIIMFNFVVNNIK